MAKNVIKRKSIYFNDQIIGEIWIRDSNTIADAVKRVLTLFNNHYSGIDPNKILVEYRNANHGTRAQLLRLLLDKPDSKVYHTGVTKSFYGSPIWNIEAFEIKLKP